MVSHSKKTERRRKNKNTAGGKDRKQVARKKGSTPPFPIHPEGKDKQPSSKPNQK